MRHRPDDDLNGGQGEGPGNSRQPAENDLLGKGQEFETPIHRRPQGLMAGYSCPRTSGQQPETVVEALGDLMGAEDTDLRCGEFEAEGDTVQSPAEAGDSGGGGGAPDGTRL